MDALKKAEQDKKSASEHLQKSVKEADPSLAQKDQESELELAPESGATADQGSELELTLESGAKVDRVSQLELTPESGTTADQGSELELAPESGATADQGSELALAPESGAKVDHGSELALAPESGAKVDQGSELELTPESGATADQGSELALAPESGTKVDHGSELELAPKSGAKADQDSASDSAPEYAHAQSAHVVPTTESRSAEKMPFNDSSNEYLFEHTSAVQLAKDIGRGAPTPANAQTIFMASASRYSVGQFLRWFTVGILFFSVIGTLGFLGYFYMLPDESIRSPISTATIAYHAEATIDAVEQTADTYSIAETEVLADEAIVEIAEQNVTSNDAYTAKEPLAALDDEILEPESEPKPKPELAANLAPKPEPKLESEPELKHELAANLERKSQPEIDENLTQAEEQGLNANLAQETEQGAIKISFSNSVDKRRALIDLAYAQYLDADYVSAAENYHKVLQELPRNRDALLGLAVINELLGHTNLAYNYYLRALKYYPQDSVVEAALLNLQDKDDLAKQENILRSLLKQQPDNAFLYYSLGALYATQQRWHEAQRVFFNAYSKESTNPDYAYNLAVSLDHIEQYDSAISYYKVSLENAENAVYIFDKGQVAGRIATLSRLAIER